MLTVIESQRELIYQCAALNEGDPYQLVEVRLVAGKELMKRRLQAFKWWSLPPAVGGGTRSKIVKSMGKTRGFVGHFFRVCGAGGVSIGLDSGKL